MGSWCDRAGQWPTGATARPMSLMKTLRAMRAGGYGQALSLPPGTGAEA